MRKLLDLEQKRDSLSSLFLQRREKHRFQSKAEQVLEIFFEKKTVVRNFGKKCQTSL